MTDLNALATRRAKLAKTLAGLVFVKDGNESRWRENFNIFLCAFDVEELERVLDDFDRVDFKDFSQ